MRKSLYWLERRGSNGYDKIKGKDKGVYESKHEADQ